jgi:Mak10 subunit, NatC N(alpha)-terminal acetyltransferase
MDTQPVYHDDLATGEVVDGRSRGKNVDKSSGVGQGIDITAFVVDCAENYLTVAEPFLIAHTNDDSNDSPDGLKQINHKNGSYPGFGASSVHDEAQDDNECANTDNHHASQPTSSSWSSRTVSHFLHEAMAASQLLDPKMDCCQIPASLIAPWHNAITAAAATVTPISTTTASSSNGNTDENPERHSEEEERLIYPRPIPSCLTDPMTPLPWHDLTLCSATFISLEILVRLQALVSGSAVGESTFTCLYAHASVLADMKQRLLVPQKNDEVLGKSTNARSDQRVDDAKINGQEDPSAETTLEYRIRTLRIDSNTADLDQTCPPQDSVTMGSIGNGDGEVVSTTLAAQWCIFTCALALVELTDAIRSIVVNADIYEEEDFVVATHNIPIYNNTLPTSSKNHKFATTALIQTALQHLESVPSCDYSTALRLVLGYQADLLSVCSTMGRLSGTNVQDSVHLAQRTVRQAVQKLKDLQGLVENKLLPVDSQSPDNSSKITSWYDTETQLVLQRCFDCFVNRVLVGNLPVRKISFERPAAAIGILATVTAEIDTCVCTFLLHGSTLGRMQRMLHRITPSNILSRSLLLLNLYFNEKLLGHYDMRALLVQDIEQWHMSSPTVDSPQSAILALDDAVAFVNRLAKPVYDTLKLKLLNRNRQRAYIEAVMLPEWVLLQNEANLVDYHCQQQLQGTGINGGGHSNHHPPNTYISRYVLSIVLRLMDRYVEAGIEVGLFSNHYDLSFALWYRDFLLSALNQNLSAARKDPEIADAVPSPSSASPPSETSSSTLSPGAIRYSPASQKQKGKKKHNKNKLAALNGRHFIDRAGTGSTPTQQVPPPPPPLTLQQPVLVEDDLELKVIAVKRNMCRKTIQFLAGLTQVGILRPAASFEFTSWPRIFANRFEVFAAMRQPPPLTFADFQQGTDFSAISSNDLLHSVTEGFQYCRTFLEHILAELVATNDQQGQLLIDPMYAPVTEAELRSLIKVCLGNSIYVQKVHQLVASGDTAQAKAVCDFGSHEQFCIIKVTTL